MTTKNRRDLKNILIYPDFQVKFIMWMLGISFAIILFITSLSYMWFSKMQTQGMQMNLPETHPYFMLLNNFSDSYLKILLASLIMTVIICVAIGSVLSHRIAGPLVKLRNHFLRMSDNQEKTHSKEITFRKKDFFKDLAESYNKTIN